MQSSKQKETEANQLIPVHQADTWDKEGWLTGWGRSRSEPSPCDIRMWRHGRSSPRNRRWRLCSASTCFSVRIVLWQSSSLTSGARVRVRGVREVIGESCDDVLLALLVGRRDPGDAAPQTQTRTRLVALNVNIGCWLKMKFWIVDLPLSRAIFGGLDLVAGLTNLRGDGSALLLLQNIKIGI